MSRTRDHGTNHRALALVVVAAAVAACANNRGLPRTRDSGQSELMGQTFAGRNKCNPDDHLRPFIIEWDATDMSSFEAYAADDIVFVRYEGCTLTVLDECRNDSIAGEQGAYEPPQWTSGSLEKIDISNEGELYAKLPLGSVSLGGRVAGGEAFHMEYYVAGTRNATRPAVYRASIQSNPGCEGATHFVYAYNLGAFALGSGQKLDTEVGGSFYGFGAGGSTKSKRSAEKQGGELSTCKADSATEIQGCQVPIRLTLRTIREGEDPDRTAMKQPDTSASVTAAMKIDTKLQMNEQARARLESANTKLQAGDGKGCLAELDKHDRLAPKQSSRKVGSDFAIGRARCLLLAGKCDAGKQLGRKWYQAKFADQWGAEKIDNAVEGLVAANCRGKNLGNREQLLRAQAALEKAAFQKRESASFCKKHIATVDRLVGKVKPKNADDRISGLRERLAALAAGCYARAGACKRAFIAFEKYRGPLMSKTMDAEQKAKLIRSNFDAAHSDCKGK